MRKIITVTTVCLQLISHHAMAEYQLHSSNEAVALLLQELVELTNVPAFSVAIVKDGRLIIQSAAGEVDIDKHTPAKPENLFRLASVSKVIGATMLSLLVQEGKLDPKAPIGIYLPNLPVQFRKLTTTQLLSHTSGMPHYQSIDTSRGTVHYETALEALNAVGSRSLLFDPGTRYQYSSHGYTILSALYEALAKAPLKQAVAELRKELTGLSTPVLEDITLPPPLLSTNYEIKPTGVETLEARDQSFSPFGTGFIASASDLAFFGDAVLHHVKFSDESRKMMFTPTMLADGSKTGNYLYEMAFGWRVGFDGSGRRVAHHAGITPGARSIIILYPDDGVSVAFLSNSRWTSSVERIGFSLADIVLENQSPVSTTGSSAFSGTFMNKPITGSLNCSVAEQTCQFSDNAGTFSAWLTRFNYMDIGNDKWPAKIFKYAGGYMIRLITSVGFVDLRTAEDECALLCYQTNVGNGRKLLIQFEKTIFKD